MKKLKLTGLVFGRLTVKVELLSRCGKAYWLCECVCGNSTTVQTSHLRSGAIKSCGCIHLEATRKRTHIHGESLTRLYRCWVDMKKRSRHRLLNGHDCNVSEKWTNFLEFKAWAKSNGYHKELVLCRNGDMGDYESDNCRWDTRENNTREWQARERITTPSTTKIT